MDKTGPMEPEDLILDPSFQEYIRTPSPETRKYWLEWQQRSEQHQANFAKARLLLISLDEQYHDDLTESELERRLIILTEKVTRKGHKPVIAQLAFTWWKVAALVIFCTGLGYWWYGSQTNFTPGKELGQSYNREQDIMEKVIKNTSRSPQTTILDDGSVVILSANSTLKVGTDFNLKDRRVQITGEAYLEVFHNPKKPFMVFMGQTMTRVLGTSFTLTTQKDEQSIQLTVRTGKVAFYKTDKNNSFEQAEGLILTPNQQALYRYPDHSLTLINHKNTVLEPIREYIYDDTPVTEVFTQLEKQYGMKIIFEKDKFMGCPITTSFASESLLERIDIICQAVGAHYEINNGEILIIGSGCATP